MMKKILLFFALMTAMVGNAQTGRWINDKDHTRIGFEVKHGGVSFVSGYFGDFDVTVNAAGEKMLDTKIDVTIKTSSVNTGIAARDKHLRTADFFDVEKFPTMTFKSTKIVAESENRGKIYGNLTMRGVTKPIVLDAWFIAKAKSPMNGKMTAGFRLTGTVKRTDFGLGPKFLPDIVGNEVHLIIDAEFSPEEK
ncbi:MAG: YceI family protein [Prevotella sp.]|jgi:polyisoprenoid-binding protein YceI